MNVAMQQVDGEREFSFSDREFEFLARMVNQHTGIVLAFKKKDMVYSRLVRRLRALKLVRFADYCNLLQSQEGKNEIGHMVNAITTNLTSFFREKHHFDHLRDKVLAPLVADPPSSRRLRIWSAGCSSGMEPYSIAMTVKEALRDSKTWDARILATDIDTSVLSTGAVGEYSFDQYENIPEPYKSDVHYHPGDSAIRMADSLKSFVAFKPLNLLESWPMKGLFDAVFCRNVVIYFDRPTQARLFSRIAEVIKPKGWLYVGHSENLFNVCDRFQSMGHTIYQRVG